MSRWSPPPVLAAWVVFLSSASLPTAAVSQTAPAPRQATPAVEKPAVPPVLGDEAEIDPWEERKIRAREDVEFLEVFLRAKQAECREAELRATHEAARKAEGDRQHQKGYTSALFKSQGGLNLAETLTQFELRRAELKDAEIRLARARRRLRAVERSGSAVEDQGSLAEDRIRELELKFERLRDLMDRAKRTDDAAKLNKLNPAAGSFE